MKRTLFLVAMVLMITACGSPRISPPPEAISKNYEIEILFDSGGTGGGGYVAYYFTDNYTVLDCRDIDGTPFECVIKIKAPYFTDWYIGWSSEDYVHRFSTSETYRLSNYYKNK